MANLQAERRLALVKKLVLLAVLSPLGYLLYRGLSDELGANPIEKITHFTGDWTLILLLTGLSASPLRWLSGWHWPLRLRRMLGLSAFFYACLHFATYLVLDQFFDWPAIVEDIVKRPYITVGFAVFLLLLPLALTSSDAAIRRLGGKRWRALHRLVYVCAAGGVVHYCWLVKKDLTKPLIFAAVFTGLMLLRWLAMRLKRLA